MSSVELSFIQSRGFTVFGHDVLNHVVLREEGMQSSASHMLLVCNWFLFTGQPSLAADLEDLYDEAHWTDQGQGMSEVVPQATLRLKNVPPGKILSLDQAIHFSIDCACKH